MLKKNIVSSKENLHTRAKVLKQRQKEMKHKESCKNIDQLLIFICECKYYFISS